MPNLIDNLVLSNKDGYPVYFSLEENEETYSLSGQIKTEIVNNIKNSLPFSAYYAFVVSPSTGWGGTLTNLNGYVIMTFANGDEMRFGKSNQNGQKQQWGIWNGSTEKLIIYEWGMFSNFDITTKIMVKYSEPITSVTFDAVGNNLNLGLLGTQLKIII